MTTYRIHDPEALNVPADFTLRLDISSEYNVKNADGSDPTASFKVKAPTVKSALQGLSLLNSYGDDNNMLQDAVLEAAVLELNLPDDDESLSDEEMAEIQERMVEVYTGTRKEWRTFILKADLDDKETGASQPIEIEMHAPSWKIMVDAYNAVTSKKRLNQLAASFMPLADDEN